MLKFNQLSQFERWGLLGLKTEGSYFYFLYSSWKITEIIIEKLFSAENKIIEFSFKDLKNHFKYDFLGFILFRNSLQFVSKYLWITHMLSVLVLPTCHEQVCWILWIWTCSLHRMRPHPHCGFHSPIFYISSPKARTNPELQARVYLHD